MSADIYEIAAQIAAAQERRDYYEPHSALWIAADATLAHWCRRLNEASEVMSERTQPAVDVVDVIRDAEDAALVQHEAGSCHLSEWSCSYCEASS